jgi:hypothetical protein
LRTNRRWGIAAAACAVLACGVLPALAGATQGSPLGPAAPGVDQGPTTPGTLIQSAAPAPVRFRLALRLSGAYRSRLTAPDRTLVHTITFASEPIISYDVYLYPSGAPPAYLRAVNGVQRTLTSGLRGRWRVTATGPDSCQASGALVDSSSGTSPLLATGHYRRRSYAVTLQAAPDADPFTYEGTHTGTDPCATSDPWQDWALSIGQVRRDGATTFHVALTITQRELQAALRGRSASIPVRLTASGGLPSGDCGSSPSLGIICRQSLGWSGRVTVSVARH